MSVIAQDAVELPERLKLPERSFLDLFNLSSSKHRRKCQAKVKKILERIQKCDPEDPNSSNQGVLVSYTLRRSTRGLCSKTDFVREGCTNLLMEILKLYPNDATVGSMFQHFETHARTASRNEKKQLAYGRILLLLILARTDKLNELEESKLIEYLEKAVGYSEHVITRTLFYEMADEILSKVLDDQQEYGKICRVLLKFKEVKNPWQLGLLAKVYLNCRKKGWQIEKIMSLTPLTRLFKPKHERKLTEILKLALSKMFKNVPDCYLSVLQYVCKQPNSWDMQKDLFLAQLSSASNKSFYFDGLAIILEHVSKDFNEERVSEIWNDMTSAKFNELKKKHLQNFISSLTLSFKKGPKQFVENFLWTLLSTGFDRQSSQLIIKDVLSSRDDLNLSKNIDGILNDLVNSDELENWQNGCSTLVRCMYFETVRVGKEQQVLEFLITQGCFQDSNNQKPYDIKNVASNQIFSFMKVVLQSEKSSCSDWLDILMHILEKQLTTVYIATANFGLQIVEEAKECISYFNSCKFLEDDKKEKILKLVSCLTVCCVTGEYEISQDIIQQFSTICETMKENNTKEKWEEFYPEFLNMIIAMALQSQKLTPNVFREVSKQIYLAFVKDISADVLQSGFDAILGFSEEAEEMEIEEEDEEVEEMEIEEPTKEVEKEVEDAGQKSAFLKERRRLYRLERRKKRQMKKSGDEGDEEKVEEKQEEEEVEEEEIMLAKTEDFFSKIDSDYFLSRAVGEQVKMRDRAKNRGNYWVRLLDVLDVTLQKNKKNPGIITVIPSMVEILRNKSTKPYWKQIKMKCKKILTGISKLKELDTEGLDQNTVMQIIEDTVKYANKCEENLDMFGKIVCLLNNTFYRCDVSLDNEDGKEINLLTYWESEILSLINKKRKKMEGDFYKFGVINCKKLTWSILIHAMKHTKPETRARLQFNLFEWLQHGINVFDQMEEMEGKQLLKEMCEAISHSVQISLLNLKHPGWKKQIIKTTSLFLRKNETKIIELGLWSHFDNILELTNTKKVAKEQIRALDRLGSFTTLCGIIENEGSNKRGKKRKIEDEETSSKGKKQKIAEN